MAKKARPTIVIPQRRVLFQHYSQLNQEYGVPPAGTLFKLSLCHGQKPHDRRNRGRDDGRHYNSGRFISPAEADGEADADEHTLRYGDRDDDLECPGYVHSVDPAYALPARHEVSLLDFAKPAKPRVAQARTGEFEIVGRVARVIALEEDDGELSEGEGWEHVEEDWEAIEQDARPRRTYSAALREDPASA